MYEGVTIAVLTKSPEIVGAREKMRRSRVSRHRRIEHATELHQDGILWYWACWPDLLRQEPLAIGRDRRLGT
jgi:hypothetical protein